MYAVSGIHSPGHSIGCSGSLGMVTIFCSGGLLGRWTTTVTRSEAARQLVMLILLKFRGGSAGTTVANIIHTAAAPMERDMTRYLIPSLIRTRVLSGGNA